MEEPKRFSYRLELPAGQTVRIGDIPRLWAAAIHDDELAQVATEESLWRTLNADVLSGKLVPLSALTLTRHEFPIGDALRRAVVLPESLRPMLECAGIALVLVEPGNGPTLWSLENAARDMGEIQGWSKRQAETLCQQMLEAARNGELVVRHPHTDLPVPLHKRAKVRDFYELVTRDDVNAWLESVGASYRWVTYEHAAEEPRYIGGRRLWKLAEAIGTIAALPGLGVTEQALTKRATKAAASRELHLRDVEDGSQKHGDNLSSVLGEWLFAEDLNAWLHEAGFSETYRLRDDMVPDASVPAFPEVPGAAGWDAASPEPMQRWIAQERAILATLRLLQFQPRALPRNRPGKPGPKAAVRKAIGSDGMWTGERVFDKAWERLRAAGEIVDKPQSPEPG